MKTNTRPFTGLQLADFLRVKKYSQAIVDSGADPWVFYKDGWYYYSRVLDDWQISVSKVRKLEDIGKRGQVVWQHPLQNAGAEVWAPEIHYVKGHWYIYFTMGKGPEHRMYVLQATADDPQGEYRLKGKISDDTNRWAIDGTVLELNSKLYFVWSGWEDSRDVRQNIYIAPMRNPWAISGKRTLIATPEYAWEKATMPGLVDVNEGPEAIQRNGKTFIIYSASHSLTNDYCLGQLTFTEGADPLLASSWTKKPEPVFCKTDASFGPGHASFVKRADGSDWIVYHTAKFSNAGWDRQVRTQEFFWAADGSPNFGQPLPVRKSFGFTSRLAPANRLRSKALK